MPLAAFITPTHHRPQLLRATLLRTLDQKQVPEGWELEVMVAHNFRDPGFEVASDIGRTSAWPVRTVEVKSKTPGAKRTAAFRAARQAALIMVADDDDMQSPFRARAAINAYVKGHKISGLRDFRFLELATGKVARWVGPNAKVGSQRSFQRKLLEKFGGWKDIPRLVDKELQSRINGRYPAREYLLKSLATSTICLQHDRNIWGERPFPAKGKEVLRGDYTLHGEGHYTRLKDFPREIVELLNESFGRKVL
jgi:hypothetical protein